MLGAKNVYAHLAYKGNFIGTNFDIKQDINNKLSEQIEDFKKFCIPELNKVNPEKSNVAAGLACSFLWTVSKGIQNADIVVCPDGTGHYYVGEVSGAYYYACGEILPHRRPIKWFNKLIPRSSMSKSLKNCTGAIGTVSEITKFNRELEGLIGQELELYPSDKTIYSASLLNWALNLNQK